MRAPVCRRPIFLCWRESYPAFLALQVRKQREINESQRSIAARERIAVVVGLSSEAGSRDHGPAARADVDRLAAQRRQEVGQSLLPHPVAQIQGTAAPNQQSQSVNLPDRRDPMLFFDA